MNRAHIIQIIFGIQSDEMDAMIDLLRNKCRKYNNCARCDHNDHNTDCPIFWTQILTEDEWKDCVQRFTILYNTYTLGRNHGYEAGQKHQYELNKREKELESEEKEDD